MRETQKPVGDVTAAIGCELGRLFHIVDRSISIRFLIDAGAQISVILIPPDQHHLRPTTFTLQAANGSPLKTRGLKLLTLGFRDC